MSRSGYSDDCDGSELNLWRGAVDRALWGKRGQDFLREMLAALDAMPVKELIAGDLTDGDRVCAIGAVGRARGMDALVMARIDPEDTKMVGKAFGIARAMAAEIAYENDDHWRPETPGERWSRMREWVVSSLRKEQA